MEKRFGDIGFVAAALWVTCTLLVPACAGGTKDNPAEVCANGVDDDGDGKADCADPDCAGEAACMHAVENCTNGTDDDGDGQVDCADSDCASTPACTPTAENCTNGTDDDGDGQADCADSDCASDPSCATASCSASSSYGAATLGNQTIADDTLPDHLAATGDLNGDPDQLVIELFNGYGVMTGGIAPGTYTLAGADLDYATCGLCVYVVGDGQDMYLATGGTVEITSIEPSLQVSFSNLTFQHVDVDQDTSETTPSADGCTSSLTSGGFDVVVTPQEICDNTTDDDGDTLADCADPDCTGTTACPTGEICGNTTDDDGDGAVDCADAECATDPSCVTCTVESAYGTPTVTNLVVDSTSLPDSLGARGDLNADPDQVQIELYNGHGVMTGGIATGTYTIAGDDLDYETCGLCVRMKGNGTDDYFATGGSVTITSLTPFAATLDDVAFEHVTIDGTTFHSTPVGDGCTATITSVTLDEGGTPPTCTAAADYGAATLTNVTPDDSNLPDEMFATGDLNTDVDGVAIDLWDGYGVFANGLAPGTYTLAGDELDPATCGLCVNLYTDYDGNAVTDFYFATGGTVTITSVDPLAATLSDVTFQHVDSNGAPVGDGCTSHITSATF